MKNLTLITGGARCGKSRLAETLAYESRLPVYYLATMPRIDGDTEQFQRIEKHRRRRPASWSTVECSMQVVPAIEGLSLGPAAAILDCLSLEVTSVMLQNGAEVDPYSTEDLVEHSVKCILDAMQLRNDIHFYVVTNETGWGIVPENPLARAFRDFLGTANQRFAQAAEDVYLMCAGLKIQLKPQPNDRALPQSCEYLVP